MVARDNVLNFTLSRILLAVPETGRETFAALSRARLELALPGGSMLDHPEGR